MSELGVSPETPVYEVAEFYEIVTGVIERRFPKDRPTTIRGEIAKVYEKGHLYLDIVDAGTSANDSRRPVLNAHCWTAKWNVLKRNLADQGINLKPGTVVSITGYADLFAPQGKVGFTITEINVQDLLGDIARRRQELITKLTTENVIGEFRANAQRAVPAVPLRIGLVASKGTEGFADFTGQFLNSGFSFYLGHVQTLVQGETAPAQIVAALRYLDEQAFDLICIVRGGGSKGDLACFDDATVARAISQCRTPIFTGIGHTGDTSIADLAACSFSITPTKLGEDVVAMVRGWYDANVQRPAERINVASQALLEQETEFVAERRRTMMFAVRDRLTAEQRHLGTVGERLQLHVQHVLDTAATSLTNTRQLLTAYDPVRRLEQGWAVVTSSTGRTVRSLADVTAGDAIQIRLRDGQLDATVTKKEGTA